MQAANACEAAVQIEKPMTFSSSTFASFSDRGRCGCECDCDCDCECNSHDAAERDHDREYARYDVGEMKSLAK